MQRYNKFNFALAVLASMTICSLAIDCYSCNGPDGETGGCGQDPFHGHFVTTPDVNITSDNLSCFVSLLTLNNYFQSTKFNHVVYFFVRSLVVMAVLVALVLSKPRIIVNYF